MVIGPVVLIALKARRTRTVMPCNGTLYVVYRVLAWDYLPAMYVILSIDVTVKIVSSVK